MAGFLSPDQPNHGLHVLYVLFGDFNLIIIFPLRTTSISISAHDKPVAGTETGATLSSEATKPKTELDKTRSFTIAGRVKWIEMLLWDSVHEEQQHCHIAKKLVHASPHKELHFDHMETKDLYDT
jgi:hypothetical protein